MKVSIIIPFFNVGAYIARCLESVAAQDWTGDMECIIVDDCGNDASLSIAEDFVASYSGPIQFVILHHEKNKGLSAARNTGIDASTGDYVFFLDSDDSISSDCIRLLSDPLNEKPYDLVIGNFQDSVNNQPVNIINEGEYGPEMMTFGLCKGKYYVTVWNKLYRKQLLSEYGIRFMEGLLFEDVLFSSEVVSVFSSMFVVDRVTYNYLIRQSSLTGSIELSSRITHYQSSLSEYVKFVRNAGLSNGKRVSNLLRYLFHICIYGPNYSFREYWRYRKGFLARYVSSRKIMDSLSLLFIKTDGFNPVRQIEDFHFFLSPYPGAICFFIVNILGACGIKVVFHIISKQ